MSKDAPTDLFRKEAIRHRTRALFGDVILAAPLSTWLIAGLLMVIMAGVVAFGVFGKVQPVEKIYGGRYHTLVQLSPEQQKIAIVISDFEGLGIYYFDIWEEQAAQYSMGDTIDFYYFTDWGKPWHKGQAKITGIELTAPLIENRNKETTHIIYAAEYFADAISHFNGK